MKYCSFHSQGVRGLPADRQARERLLAGGNRRAVQEAG